MTKYHVSQDGQSRVCSARTAESCTAVGPDGGSAPHGDFNTASEAVAFAERVNASSAGSFLDSVRKSPEGIDQHRADATSRSVTKKRKLEDSFDGFYGTEFGSQFKRSSFRASDDGETFTAVVGESFIISGSRYNRGDRIRLDREFNIVPLWRRD